MNSLIKKATSRLKIDGFYTGILLCMIILAIKIFINKSLG
jgi:hypothetical protein